MGLNFEGLPGWLRPQRRVPRQLAVALGYQPGRERAPEILARGGGLLAERILEAAREHGVPVHEDADLAEVLARLDVGSEVPEELYEAVAQLLAFIYRMNSGFRSRRGG